MFYDEGDIKKVATVSARVRDMAAQKDYDALFEAKKLSLYTFCPINYEIGHRLYEEADKLEKTWTEDRYERLVAAIQETGGRIFRYMIENFASDKAQAERNLSAGLRSFFSKQTAKRITLNYKQIERLINGKLPEKAYGQYKAETFWKECGADFSKSWRDYGYKVLFVYAGNGSDTDVVFEK